MIDGQDLFCFEFWDLFLSQKIIKKKEKKNFGHLREMLVCGLWTRKRDI